MQTTLAPAALLAALLGLAACNSTAPAPQAAPTPSSGVPYVTKPGFKLPEGGGCAGETARYQAIMDNDLETGHVNKAVHSEISGEIAGARSACAAGRDAEARGLVTASRKRHGYPVGL
jgi:hypothetical protein